MNDLRDLLEIEESAIPGYAYLEEAADFLVANNGNEGEMILALADGIPAGMGRYSVLPDGGGWLEILRVRKEFQRQGVGAAIYGRYMELAKEYRSGTIAMFTGRKNIASRTLAEKNGLCLNGEYSGYDLVSERQEEKPEGFSSVENPADAAGLIDPWRDGCDKYMCFNRTFMHWGMPLYEYLCKRGMVFSDGESTIVAGWRMLRQRGLHIGFMTGDLSRCMAFATAKAEEEGLPKVSFMFPKGNADLEALMSFRGSVHTGDLIVMEKSIQL